MNFITQSNRSRKILPGFTLVELLVVITILAILATIGFISVQGYSSSARDSSRISNLTNLHKWLVLYQVVSGTFPMPENPITLSASGFTIGYQGFAMDQTTGIAKLSAGSTRDPLDSSMYITYATNAAQTKIQLMNFLEDGSKITAWLGSPMAFASANTNYSTRNPITKGDALGILMGTGSSANQPIQELASATFTGVDIVNTNTGYTMYITKTQQYSGTGIALKATIAGDGLIGYWSFDEGTGSATYDNSGNGNNGTLSGDTLPGWTGGKIGGGLSFANNYVLVNPNFWDKGNAITINTWVYARSTAYAATFISKDNGPGDTIDKRSWYFSLGGSGTGTAEGFKAAMWTWDNHDRKDILSPTFELNKWNNVTFVYNGQLMKLCLNGVCTDTLSDSGYISNSNNIPVRIWMINSNYYFDGILDEMRVYNRALSDSEIAMLYNTTK